MPKNKSKSIAVAAQSAGAIATRFSSVETEATRIHAEQSGARVVRALLGEQGIHAVLSDQHGATLEICGGQVAVSIKS